MTNPLKNKTILLGVTGSIAAYKAAELASKLKKSEALVNVVLTQSALQFIPPLTFQSVTARKAYTDADLWGGEGHVTHIGLGQSAQLMVVAPISANTIAKLANGIGDNLLTVTALAARCPLVIAPAMDSGMFDHPATQKNVSVLRERGVTVLGPASGHLASGLVGPGRMLEPIELYGHIRYILSRNGPLSNKKIVVTAGGTQEDIDPVRIITNRSSGKQGFAIAQAAIDSGADVVLIYGNTNLTPPIGCKSIQALSAAEMSNQVMHEVVNADALIMAAAVADFKPATPSSQKIKKENSIPQINLERTVDILTAVSVQKSKTGFPRKLIGFAAESQALIENARSKMVAKKLDIIVANDISARDAGFEVDTNKVSLLFADGNIKNLPVMKKDEVAEEIINILCKSI